jgi:hypothetical protein
MTIDAKTGSADVRAGWHPTVLDEHNARAWEMS